jgi:transcriptional regulator with PAS, ATPase and Fis domain
MKEIFEIGETYINDHLDFNKINKIKLNINDYLNKSFETFSPQDQKLFLDQYNEYVTLLFKFYNEKLQSGKIPTKNDFQTSLNNYILDQKNILKEYRLILNDKNIFDDFKQKFSKTDWPNNFTDIIKKMDEFNKSDYKLMIGSKTNDIWNKFIYPSNVHLKKIKNFDQEIKTWIEMGSDKFKNYYNEQKYGLNNKKSLDEIKNKQKDLSIFDKLGN